MSSKTNLKYHLIIVTKYRKKVLTPNIMQSCVSVLSKVLLENNCEILSIKGDNEDHVHILFQCKPSISISLLVQLLKQKSTYYVWQKYPELRQHYWYKDVLWSKGYYCDTTGEVNEKQVKKYIEQQGNN